MKGNDLAYPMHGFNKGLTKRELFAAMAMKGMLSNPNVRLKPNTISKWAVNHADALIERLSVDPVAEGLNLLPMYSRELDEVQNAN